jgi:hypothetical protein
MNKYVIGLLACNLLLAAGGCSNSLTLEAETDIPVPLVNQLPLNLGVYYDDAFRNYAYTEDSEDRPNWTISSGASQVMLFNKILPPMFKTVRQLDAIDTAGDENLDAILVPQIEEMQFALPRETGSDLYEVWIKYRIQMYSDGELIAGWPITGYGKSSTEFLTSREEGLQAAINSAFRDAGAKFSLSFARVNEVNQWLSSKTDMCLDNTDAADLC